jgi:hypothetical protein
MTLRPKCSSVSVFHWYDSRIKPPDSCRCSTVNLLQIIESINNPKIQLYPWLWKLIDEAEMYGPQRALGDESTPIESLRLRNLAKIPGQLQHVQQHILEVKYTYQRMRDETVNVGQRLAKLTEPCSIGINQSPPVPVPVMRLHASLRAAYVMLLTLTMIYNAALRALDPDDVPLRKESVTFSNAIVKFAEHSSQYRPIGANSISLCLVAAWAAMDDTSTRVKVTTILGEYQADFPQIGWMGVASRLKNRFKSLHVDSSMSKSEQAYEISFDKANTLKDDLRYVTHSVKSCAVTKTSDGVPTDW